MNKHYLKIVWCAIGLAVSVKGLFNDLNATSIISALHSLVSLVFSWL